MSDRANGVKGLDEAALRRGPFGATVELHASLGSTSDRARELLERGAALPALVVTDQQTAGRGRGANRWWSSSGALTFSIALNAKVAGVPPQRFGVVSIATALAVIDAVRETARVAAGLKWPNDVYLGGRKLAGVLIESPSRERLVIGVGVNVANRFDGAPEEVRARAVSLAEQTSVSRQEVLVAFLRALDERLPQVAAADSALIHAARTACVLTGKIVTLRDGGRVATGECQGIADDGALQLRSDSGVTSYYAGTIERAAENV